MLELHTNKLDIAPLTIGIDMTIVSDISVLGGAYFNEPAPGQIEGPEDQDERYAPCLPSSPGRLAAWR